MTLGLRTCARSTGPRQAVRLDSTHGPLLSLVMLIPAIPQFSAEAHPLSLAALLDQSGPPNHMLSATLEHCRGRVTLV